MGNKLFRIKINSSEENKDLGFEVILRSKSQVICLEDEQYIVSGDVLSSLIEEGVSYDPLDTNGDLIKDATPNKS